MGEPQTKGALANQSHVGSGGYQDNTKMEEKAARWQGEADNDSGMQEAMKQGDASGEKTQAHVEKLDKDYVPSDEAKATPENYDGPATRTRATSDSPPDPYTTEVPEPPSDM